MVQDVNSAFRQISPCSTSAQLLRGRGAAYGSPAFAATLLRPVYESSFRTSKEKYDTSHNQW